MAPFLKYSSSVKHLATYGGPTAPAEILAMFFQHRDYRRVPRRQERCRQIVPAGNEPAHRCGCADLTIVKRRDQPSQPRPLRPSVRVRKYKHLKISWQLLDCHPQIIYFFSATLGPIRNNNMSLDR